MAVDVLMHLDCRLDSSAAEGIRASLRALPGMGELIFEEHAPRFLRFTYDPRVTTAKHVLDAVEAMGYRGRLVAI